MGDWIGKAAAPSSCSDEWASWNPLRIGRSMRLVSMAGNSAQAPDSALFRDSPKLTAIISGPPGTTNSISSLKPGCARSEGRICFSYACANASPAFGFTDADTTSTNMADSFRGGCRPRGAPGHLARALCRCLILKTKQTYVGEEAQGSFGIRGAQPATWSRSRLAVGQTAHGHFAHPILRKELRFHRRAHSMAP